MPSPVDSGTFGGSSVGGLSRQNSRRKMLSLFHGPSDNGIGTNNAAAAAASGGGVGGSGGGGLFPSKEGLHMGTLSQASSSPPRPRHSINAGGTTVGTLSVISTSGKFESTSDVGTNNGIGRDISCYTPY